MLQLNWPISLCSSDKAQRPLIGFCLAVGLLLLPHLLPMLPIVIFWHLRPIPPTSLKLSQEVYERRQRAWPLALDQGTGIASATIPASQWLNCMMSWFLSSKLGEIVPVFCSTCPSFPHGVCMSSDVTRKLCILLCKLDKSTVTQVSVLILFDHSMNSPGRDVKYVFYFWILCNGIAWQALTQCLLSTIASCSQRQPRMVGKILDSRNQVPGFSSLNSLLLRSMTLSKLLKPLCASVSSSAK